VKCRLLPEDLITSPDIGTNSVASRERNDLRPEDIQSALSSSLVFSPDTGPTPSNIAVIES
jgi:hypothetical protein